MSNLPDIVVRKMFQSQNQMSADKDIESPDTYASSLSGRTDYGQLFSENPDRIRAAGRIETEKIRTGRHQTESGQNLDSRHTPENCLLEWLRTGFSGQNETRTGHGLLSADVGSEQAG